MSFSVQRIGVTGPSGRIGSGTEYHIDTKFKNNLSFEQIRDRMDAIARQYQTLGREIEFSNQGVASQTYDLSSTPEERLSLLRRAAGAHSSRPGWHSFDYYAPTAGKGRWDKSSEGAPIFVAGASGLKVQGGTGGNYGNYAFVLDKDGRVISKSGHGDDSLSVYGGGVLGGATPSRPNSTVVVAPLADDDGNKATPAIVQARERAKTYADMSKSEINAEYDRLRQESPDTAAEEGLKMHQAFFGK